MGRIVTRKNGQRIHVGGRLPPTTPHKLMLHAPKFGLNLSQWPTPPSSTSWGSAPAAQAVLTSILGNDTLGDCTEADQYHRQAIRQAAAGSPVFVPSVDQVIATYSRDGGYIVGQPSTDQGCDETVVLGNDVSQGITNGTGIAKAAGYVGIDGSNGALVRAVIAAFPGGTPVCGSLPQSWIQQATGPGFVWDVPNDPFVPSNGHCWTLADFDQTGLPVWSWGMPGRMTYDGLAAASSPINGGALYLVCDAETLNAASQLAPDGLDWAQVLVAFQDAGGTTS
jgi:hypothetical protein